MLVLDEMHLCQRSVCTDAIATHKQLVPPQRRFASQVCHRRRETQSRNCTRNVNRSCRCRAAAPASADAEQVPALGEGVLVDAETLSNSRVQLSITLPAAQSKRAWQRAIRKVSMNLSLPGFRKGKQIPESVLFQHVPKDEVVREAAEMLITNCLTEVGQSYKETAYTDSLTMDTPPEEVTGSFSPDQDFKFKISFDVQPELSWKGDYKKLKIDVEEAGTAETDRLLVEKRVNAAKKEKGRLQVVTDRGLQIGDVALVDFEARAAATGEPIAGSKREGLQVDTDERINSIGIPGIVDDLVGMAVGESKSAKHVVPNAWWEFDLRGSDIICDIKIRELFSWDLPELTDDFAKQILPSCSGVDDLWQKLTEAQQMVTASDTADAVNQALTMAVADIVEAEVPEALIREAALNEYQAQLLEMQARGSLDREMMDQLATEEMLDKFIETRRDEIAKMQRGVLGFEAIFEAEGLTISEEEVEAEAKAALGEAKDAGEEMQEDRLRQQVFEVIKAMKVLGYLTDISEINLLPPSSVSH